MTDADPGLEQWLRRFLSRNGGVAGTVHLLRGQQLELAAAVNIPPKVVEVVRAIPRGKGMAGRRGSATSRSTRAT